MMDQSTMGQQFPKSQSTKSDTIYRADAIKAVEDLQDCYNGFSSTYDKAQIIGALEEVPTAERKGRWIGADTDKVKCNCCGKSYDWTSEAQYYDYCPSCGARMERE